MTSHPDDRTGTAAGRIADGLLPRIAAAMVALGVLLSAAAAGIAAWAGPPWGSLPILLLLFGTGQAVLLAGLAAVLLRRQVTDPLARIAAAIAAWASDPAGSGQLPVPAGRGEVGALGAALDGLRTAVLHRQERLAASRERFRDFARVSGDVLWETDREHRLSLIGGDGVGFDRAPPQDYLGRTRWEIAADADDRAKWDAHRADLQAQRPFRDLRYRMETGSGPIWLRVSGMPRFAEDGSFLGYRGISSEISDEAQQGEDLRLFRQALEGCMDGVIITGPEAEDFPVRYVNPAFERITGYRAEEVLGRNCRMLQGPHRDQPAMTEVRHALRCGTAVRVEVLNQRRDGSPIRVELSISPVPDASGRTRHFVGIQHDVTAQRQANDELQLLSERLTQTVRATGIGIYDIDMRTGRIEWDETMERLYGIPPGSFGNSLRAWQDFIHPDDLLAHAEAIRDATAAGTGTLTRTRIRRPDGQVRVMLFHSGIIWDADGNMARVVGVNRDITEEHEAHERLRALSQRLTLATDAAGIGIFEVDLKTWRVAWDRNMAALYGVPLATFDGSLKTWRGMIHPDDVSSIDAGFAARAESGAPIARVLRIRRSDDRSERFLQTHVVILHDDAGKPARIVGVNWDITEDRRAQERVRALGQRLSLATEAAGIGIFDVDLRARRVQWDQQMARLFGLALEDFDGRFATWRRHIEPEEIPLIEARFAESSRTGLPYEGMLKIRRADGVPRILQERALILNDEAGAPMRVIGVNWDVTEDQSARAALQRLTERLTLTARAAGIGFFEWDEAEGTDTWDDTLRGIHGVGPDFQAGMDGWLALLDPGDRPRARAFIRERFKTRKSGALDYRIARGDGAVRDLQIHVAPDVDAGGRVVRILGAGWDVTEERETERQLRQARDVARAANEAKDRFLATMSHELRTPLNAVLGFSEVIREEAVGPLGNPAYRDYADDIHRSGEHLLSLVNDLIDIARVQSATVRLSESRVSVAELLDGLPPLLGGSAVAHAVPDSALAAELTCDPRLLTQVLVNLISNARKHAAGSAEVVLGVGRLASGDMVLWVVDHGPGIAPEDQRHVLEPFGRMAATEEAAIPGVGLGLPIARSFVEGHGGKLFLHSAPGTGTTVGAILPARRIAWPAPPASPPPLPVVTAAWPAGPCLGCLGHEAAGVVRGRDSGGLLLEHTARCVLTGAEGDACAHWGEQILRAVGGIDALADPGRPVQAFASCSLPVDGATVDCLIEVRRGARTPCRAFVTPVSHPGG